MEFDFIATGQGQHIAKVIGPVIILLLIRIAGISAFGNIVRVTEGTPKSFSQLLLQKDFDSLRIAFTGTDHFTGVIQLVHCCIGNKDWQISIIFTVDFHYTADIISK